MSNLKIGKKEIEFGLKTSCIRNTASFRWGGLNDIAFLIDNKTLKRYVLFQRSIEDEFTQILEINSSFNFDLNSNITLPIAKKLIGFCFVYDGIFYIGNYHYKPEINFIFRLYNVVGGLEKFNLCFEYASYITNINILNEKDGLKLLVSDYYSGLLIYDVNLST